MTVLPVTRTELIDHVEKAFTAAPVTREKLVTAAEATNARAEVIAVLGTLSAGSFRSPRDLWGELGDLPISA